MADPSSVAAAKVERPPPANGRDYAAIELARTLLAAAMSVSIRPRPDNLALLREVLDLCVGDETPQIRDLMDAVAAFLAGPSGRAEQDTLGRAVGDYITARHAPKAPDKPQDWAERAGFK